MPTLWALEEARKRAIEESELNELARWPGLAQALANLAAGMQANASRPPPAPSTPEPAQTWLWPSMVPVYVSCPAVWVGAADKEAER